MNPGPGLPGMPPSVPPREHHWGVMVFFWLCTLYLWLHLPQPLPQPLTPLLCLESFPSFVRRFMFCFLFKGSSSTSFFFLRFFFFFFCCGSFFFFLKSLLNLLQHCLSSTFWLLSHRTCGIPSSLARDWTLPLKAQSLGCWESPPYLLLSHLTSSPSAICCLFLLGSLMSLVTFHFAF